jgi:hypothetical protein
MKTDRRKKADRKGAKTTVRQPKIEIEDEEGLEKEFNDFLNNEATKSSQLDGK